MNNNLSKLNRNKNCKTNQLKFNNKIIHRSNKMKSKFSLIKRFYLSIYYKKKNRLYKKKINPIKVKSYMNCKIKIWKYNNKTSYRSNKPSKVKINKNYKINLWKYNKTKYRSNKMKSK